MPPHLHPRSRLTSSLFATTLLASFVVVGIPHVLPCPAPRVAYADSETMTVDGTTVRRRRRRKCVDSSSSNTHDTSSRNGGSNCSSKDLKVLSAREEDGSSLDDDCYDDDQLLQRRRPGRRECPIPKPGGIMGEVLGFRSEKAAASDAARKDGEKGVRPP